MVARKVGVWRASCPITMRDSQMFRPAADQIRLERGQVHEHEVVVEPAEHPPRALEVHANLTDA
jgi:hypothetical protein